MNYLNITNVTTTILKVHAETIDDKALEAVNECDQKDTSSNIDFNGEETKITITTNENAPLTDNVDKIKIKTCQHCNTHHFEGNCPVEFPHYVITDALDRNEWIKKYKPLHEKKFNIANNNKGTDIDHEINKYSYSFVSLPDCLSISYVQDEPRIFANIDLEPFTQFGPLVGKLVKEKDIPEDIEMKYIWEAFEPTENIYYNTESTSMSNWTNYIRPAPKKEEKNVIVTSREKKLYFITVKFIRNGEELLYWQYSSSPTVKKKMEKTGN